MLGLSCWAYSASLCPQSLDHSIAAVLTGTQCNDMCNGCNVPHLHRLCTYHVIALGLLCNFLVMHLWLQASRL